MQEKFIFNFQSQMLSFNSDFPKKEKQYPLYVLFRFTKIFRQYIISG